MGRPKRDYPQAYLSYRSPDKSDPEGLGSLDIVCAYQRKPAQVSIGLKLKPSFFDKEARKVTGGFEGREPRINKLIADALEIINGKIRERIDSKSPIDKEVIGEIIRSVNPAVAIKRTLAMSLSQIADMERSYSKEEIKDPKEINRRFWLSNTIKITLPYCSLMLMLLGEKMKLSQVESHIQSYVYPMQDLLNDKTLTDEERQVKLSELFDKTMKPFQPLKAYIHEYSGKDMFQARHLSYKIAAYRDEARKITYELLFEYDILDPVTECYYGIKAISDNNCSDDEFEHFCNTMQYKFFRSKSDASSLEDFLNAPKTTIYQGGKFYNRMKFTNNAQNGTFWISWVRMDIWQSLWKDLIDLKEYMAKPFLSFYENVMGELPLHTLYDKFSEARIVQIRKFHLEFNKDFKATTPYEVLKCRLETRYLDSNSEDGIKLYKKDKEGLEGIESRIHDLLQNGVLEELEGAKGEFVIKTPVSKARFALEYIINEEYLEYKLSHKNAESGENDKKRLWMQTHILQDIFHKIDLSRFTDEEIKGLKKIDPREGLEYGKTLLSKKKS